jgi:hypothetical protein
MKAVLLLLTVTHMIELATSATPAGFDRHCVEDPDGFTSWK